jgi:hypothetical protein
VAGRCWRSMLRASFTEADLPPAHLIHAGFSLPFCPPQQFPSLWTRICQALVPGGVFAGQLFGIRDSWAADAAMTFHDRLEAEALLDGLRILRLHETDHDGRAFTGPKHWHVFDILARRHAPVSPIGLPLRTTRVPVALYAATHIYAAPSAGAVGDETMRITAIPRWKRRISLTDEGDTSHCYSNEFTRSDSRWSQPVVNR